MGSLLRKRWGGNRLEWRTRSSYPDQHATVFIHGQALAINEFFLQILQDVIVQLELALEGTIGHASAALEQSNCLVQQLLKSHG
jgi:hypothetical protein